MQISRDDDDDDVVRAMMTSGYPEHGSDRLECFRCPRGRVSIRDSVMGWPADAGV